jgi:hypothetical protein
MNIILLFQHFSNIGFFVLVPTRRVGMQFGRAAPHNENHLLRHKTKLVLPFQEIDAMHQLHSAARCYGIPTQRVGTSSQIECNLCLI